MASTLDRRRAVVGVVAVAGTAALGWLGTGLEPRWWAAWMAPLPVLVYAAGAVWWRAAIVATVAWFLGTLGLWTYLHDELRLPAAPIAMFLALPSVVFGGSVLLYRGLLQRRAGVAAVVGFAAVRVVWEGMIAIAGPHGTAGSLAYSQVECLPVLQLASITGPWGITFLVMAVPAAIAAAWQLARHTRGAAARQIGGGAVVVVAGVVVFGAARLADAPAPVVRVGLIASDPPTSPQQAKQGAATTALLDAYARGADRLAAQGAQVIVLPEKLGVVADAAEMDARFQAVADRSRAMIAVGVVHEPHNEARIYAPGAAARTYHKQHMLLPYEPFEPGDALTVIPQLLGAWGVQICKDLDFPALSRRYGRAGVAIMLVPAWDFDLDGRWHARMAVMRGVESGFAVVRAAKRGLLQVSDSRGRIVGQAASNAAPFSTLIADAPSRHADTVYQRLGDWFGWFALAALAASLLPFRRRRASHEP